MLKSLQYVAWLFLYGTLVFVYQTIVGFQHTARATVELLHYIAKYDLFTTAVCSFLEISSLFVIIFFFFIHKFMSLYNSEFLI